MRLDITTSWGYPVLRPQIDDYVGGEFESKIELRTTSDFKEIELSYTVSLSVSELKALVTAGKAKVVIYLFCRDTWFSKQIDASGWKGAVSFNADLVSGETQIWTLIVAKGKTKNFKSKKFHPEYGRYSLNIEDNQILAIARPESSFISRDVLKNVSSLFDYDVNNNLSNGEWRLIVDENRLVIVASEEQVRFLRQGENSTQGKAALLNGVFLPALTQAVHTLTADRSTYEQYAWGQILGARIDGLKDKQDALDIAQQLLRSPLNWLNKYMGWMNDTA